MAKKKSKSKKKTSKSKDKPSSKKKKASTSKKKAGKKKSVKRSTTPKPVVLTHDQVAKRAFELWMDKGQPSGQDEAIWKEAEAQLLGAS